MADRSRLAGRVWFDEGSRSPALYAKNECVLNFIQLLAATVETQATVYHEGIQEVKKKSSSSIWMCLRRIMTDAGGPRWKLQ